MTIARLMPRVRTAGSAKSTPSGIAAATPSSSASQNGVPWAATSRPADVRAEARERELRERELPGVAGEHDDREQDRATRRSVIVIASVQLGTERGEQQRRRRPTPTAVHGQLIRPLPTVGSRWRK